MVIRYNPNYQFFGGWMELRGSSTTTSDHIIKMGRLTSYKWGNMGPPLSRVISLHWHPLIFGQGKKGGHFTPFTTGDRAHYPTSWDWYIYIYIHLHLVNVFMLNAGEYLSIGSYLFYTGILCLLHNMVVGVLLYHNSDWTVRFPLHSNKY